MTAATRRELAIATSGTRLGGTLDIPEDATGLVLFAHGSGSSRFSPRNQYVAGVLREHGIGTLLMDLLEQRESEDRTKVFDIDLLARRLAGATDWIRDQEETGYLNIGYFGASTGAAAALQAAAQQEEVVKAIVSRGGRPDLAMEWLSQITAPTLLIVGGNDAPVIDMNDAAYRELPGTKKLVIVPGATHLFEEPGKLEEVAALAADWFNTYLT